MSLFLKIFIFYILSVVFWLFIEKFFILKKVLETISLESISEMQTAWFKKNDSLLDEEKKRKKRKGKKRKGKKKRKGLIQARWSPKWRYPWQCSIVYYQNKSFPINHFEFRASKQW